MGNTCYLNSVIQCLHMTPSLTDRIRKHLTPETKLSKKYIKLMDKMEKKEHMVLCPQALRSVFVQRCPQFNSFSQQDAQEFLTILIDLLNEELKKKATSTLSRKISAAQPGGMHGTFSPRQRVSASSQAWENFCLENDSPVTSTFYGLFESRCQFRDCGHESSVFDPFSSLTLPFPMAETHLVTIKVVPFFGAVPEIVHVQTSGPEESSYVRHELSRKYSCLPTQLFFCVLSKGVIMKCSIEPELPGPTSELWAFILSQRPPLNREKLTSVPSKILTIVAQNRVLSVLAPVHFSFKVPFEYPLFKETSVKPELFGIPNVLQVSASSTNRELYWLVERCIHRFHQSSRKPELHEGCRRAASKWHTLHLDGIYRPSSRPCSASDWRNVLHWLGIRPVRTANGTKCMRFVVYQTPGSIFLNSRPCQGLGGCARGARGPSMLSHDFLLKTSTTFSSLFPFNRMCYGCSIPCDSNNLSLVHSRDGCVYLTIDWNLAAYVNEYQLAQQMVSVSYFSSNLLKYGTAVRRRDTFEEDLPPAKRPIQLTSLLNNFFGEESVQEEQGVVCEPCGSKKSFAKSIAICNLPDTLVSYSFFAQAKLAFLHTQLISLKRFQATRHGWRKSSRDVCFPLTSLDMRPYLATDSSDSDDAVYDLYAVVNHVGNLDEGHYYAFVRNEDERWFQVNDTECCVSK
ncbi:unnamed protein product [Mesocestoides corti]|uniref:ubiquitinyl hydrolase 1 n=1 Tax=Mesocestoides corti TaxID=53468 RepID=A0A0R3UKE4_MESCO|nr:unnamed protein product [Mesocestoides corti]